MSEHAKKNQHFEGSDFGSKVTFTVGVSYMIGFLSGGVQALFGFTKPAPAFQTLLVAKRKLALTSFFNNLGKFTSLNGNAFAAAGLLYTAVGAILNLAFEDQFDQFSSLTKNAVCGFSTGFIYKLHRSVRAGCVGGLVGTAIISIMTLLVEHGNKKGYIAFEMKY